MKQATYKLTANVEEDIVLVEQSRPADIIKAAKKAMKKAGVHDLEEAISRMEEELLDYDEKYQKESGPHGLNTHAVYGYLGRCVLSITDVEKNKRLADPVKISTLPQDFNVDELIEQLK